MDCSSDPPLEDDEQLLITQQEPPPPLVDDTSFNSFNLQRLCTSLPDNPNVISAMLASGEPRKEKLICGFPVGSTFYTNPLRDDETSEITVKTLEELGVANQDHDDDDDDDDDAICPMEETDRAVTKPDASSATKQAREKCWSIFAKPRVLSDRPPAALYINSDDYQKDLDTSPDFVAQNPSVKKHDKHPDKPARDSPDHTRQQQHVPPTATIIKLDETPQNLHHRPIYYEYKDQLIQHPRLPSGWEICISKSKNRPYYKHPDHGTTWHCPVPFPVAFFKSVPLTPASASPVWICQLQQHGAPETPKVHKTTTAAVDTTAVGDEDDDSSGISLVSTQGSVDYKADNEDDTPVEESSLNSSVDGCTTIPLHSAKAKDKTPIKRAVTVDTGAMSSSPSDAGSMPDSTKQDAGPLLGSESPQSMQSVRRGHTMTPHQENHDDSPLSKTVNDGKTTSPVTRDGKAFSCQLDESESLDEEIIALAQRHSGENRGTVALFAVHRLGSPSHLGGDKAGSMKHSSPPVDRIEIMHRSVTRSLGGDPADNFNDMDDFPAADDDVDEAQDDRPGADDVRVVDHGDNTCRELRHSSQQKVAATRTETAADGDTETDDESDEEIEEEPKDRVDPTKCPGTASSRFHPFQVETGSVGTMSTLGGGGKRSLTGMTHKTTFSLRILNPPHPLCSLQSLELLQKAALAKKHSKTSKFSQSRSCIQSAGQTARKLDFAR
jgi:hypothetical protein